MKQGRFLSCMYMLSLTLLTAFALHGLRAQAAVAGEAAIPRIIVLDAGHGGADGGASGPDGTRECDLNLAITLKTDAVLGLLGEETLLLRSTDTDLSSSDSKSISQKKVSDIRRRVELTNSQPGAILVSIHCNTYSQEKYHGAQVFYTGGAKEFGETMQLALKNGVDPSNARMAKAVSPDVYLMNHVKVPGILVECGFLTNQEELTNLKDPDYQTRLAVTIAVTAANQASEPNFGVSLRTYYERENCILLHLLRK
ncbi:MAG: N-acetylmuramoyl-L-alanine amidase [Oscillospiraceae bacterium]|nr:N-acetylmuramoyl-L-alanine amidase [Oscillospiraceae bacterium]